MKQRIYFSWILILATLSCQFETPLFKLRDNREIGIDFINNISESDTINLIDNTNMYNGAGVAIGDINNDGLPDVLLGGNMVSSHVYLNKGNWKFEDITETSGLLNTHWVTGISLVDLNLDGFLDVYFSCSITESIGGRSNLLYLSKGIDKNGIPTFREVAVKAGIADTAFTTQTAFFDYDHDGDLDAYCLTNTTENFVHSTLRPKKIDGTGWSNDRMYRNEGLDEDGIPQFSNVTEEAGILTEGYGLGISITDVNRDGWMDIYVANDFITNDLLYINNQDGTFSNQIADYIQHQSHNAMGIDVADIDNNGWEDIVVLDMLPESNEELKQMQVPGSYDRYWMATERLDYEPQYVRNTLQLNHGNGKYSEIGQLSGIDKTHWSWAPLLVDFDHDGWRDLFISNGYPKNIIDLDYVNYVSTTGMFGTKEAVKKRQAEQLSQVSEIQPTNYIYKNNGELQFEDKSYKWGFTQPSVSNGAAYGDLDLDGDLDLIVNNINQSVFVFENTLSQQTSNTHYLRLAFQGSKLNPGAIGTKVKLWSTLGIQVYEHSPLRGFQSFVEPIAHFGLDTVAIIDSLKIYWPDGKQSFMTNIPADQVITLSYEDSQEANEVNIASNNPIYFFKKVDSIGLDYHHKESDFVDFKHSILLPHQHTCEGPSAAVADINGDGLEDIFFGGASGTNSQLFIQTSTGDFEAQPFPETSEYEDLGALFIDIDNDGDQDLYVVSGGTEYERDDMNYQDRVYVNDGKGVFSLGEDLLPNMTSSGSCVVAADYDKDGDLDVFVGGRIIPKEYPLPAQSFLLENQGGKFVDITEKVLERGHEQGLITTAIWTDIDKDGWIDLMIAGEWMPIKIFKNENGKSLKELDIEAFKHSHGWWNSLIAGDFDQDGDMDYVAGNRGLNGRYQASPEEPVMLYAKDYDQNETIDPIMAYYIQGELEIAHPRGGLINQLVAMKKRFVYHEQYAKADFDKILYPHEREGAYICRAEQFASCFIQNLGNGKFEIQELPIEAQFSTIKGMIAEDVNQDTKLDLVVVGNFYPADVELGRYDASIGLILLGDGRGNFSPLSATKSGFLAEGDTRALVKIMNAKDEPLFISTENDGELAIHSKRQEHEWFYRPAVNDIAAEIYFQNGKEQRYEFNYGSGYLSQSSKALEIDSKVDSVVIFSHKGSKVLK